jgi:predicted nucleic acid-binding protein
MERVLGAGIGFVTTQAVGEYFVCLTRTAKLALPLADALEHVRALTDFADVLPLTLDVVEMALHGVERYGMPYYDAQLWAAARLAAIPVLLTEDGPSGNEIGGVRFVNPFADGFDVDALLTS